MGYGVLVGNVLLELADPNLDILFALQEINQLPGIRGPIVIWI